MKDLQFAVPFGVFLRNVHRWSAQAMVLMVILHMARVFYTGSYKKPREFNWAIGVGLLALTLFLSFTGYLLPWDQLAYWAVTVGTNMARSTPLVGATGPFHEILGAQIDNDVRFAMLGGTIVGQNALLRFYVLHCMAIPVIFVIMMAVHFWRIRKDGGISRPAVAAEVESPVVASESPALAAKLPAPAAGSRFRLLAYIPGRTFSGKRDATEAEVATWPHLVLREFLAAVTVIIGLWVFAILFNAPLEEKANPALTPNPAKAPWYFVGLQELLAYFDPWIAGVIIPNIVLVGLALIPFLDVNPAGSGEYGFSKRKFAVSVFTFGFLFWFALIFIGLFMRGPSWAWYWPWENWTEQKETLSATWNLPVLWGAVAMAGYFGLGLLVPARLFPKFYRALGPVRYIVTMTLLLLMLGVPAKIVLRLAFNVKYILTTVWFNI
jgi:quinol-cytochrome oxidoreductase complex cytochrome b subunit